MAILSLVILGSGIGAGLSGDSPSLPVSWAAQDWEVQKGSLTPWGLLQAAGAHPPRGLSPGQSGLEAIGRREHRRRPPKQSPAPLCCTVGGLPTQGRGRKPTAGGATGLQGHVRSWSCLREGAQRPRDRGQLTRAGPGGGMGGSEQRQGSGWLRGSQPKLQGGGYEACLLLPHQPGAWEGYVLPKGCARARTRRASLDPRLQG